MSSWEILKIGLRPPREKLRKKINARIQTWLKRGLLREVKNLRKSGLSWKRLNELGLEYRYPALYLQGKISREEMVRKMETETWRYAKRQMTWFKRDTEIRWVENKKEAFQLASHFLKNSAPV
jgi:tRNA dimethylallyltransferase